MDVEEMEMVYEPAAVAADLSIASLEDSPTAPTLAHHKSLRPYLVPLAWRSAGLAAALPATIIDRVGGEEAESLSDPASVPGAAEGS